MERDLEIKILIKKTGGQEVTIGGTPYELSSFTDKLVAIREAAKAKCGIEDFIKWASIDTATPCAGNA